MENKSIENYINIENYIKEVFPENEYVVKYKNYSSNKFIIYTTKDEGCLDLEFFEDHIYIIHINKCGFVSGTNLLKKIDELVEKIPKIEYIELRDGSTININNVDIDLAFLKILTKGKSWYNSLGYVSSNYSKEILHNNKLRNTHLIEVLNSCKPKLIKDFDGYIDYFEGYNIDIDSIEPDEMNRIVEEKIELLKSKIKEHFSNIKINIDLTEKNRCIRRC
jgi:hypothetical protein